MALKDQLPYLGEIQEDGSLQIGEYITLDKDDLFGIRPDYKEFKNKQHQSEFNCAAVLIGIRGIENCKQIIDKFGYKIAQEEKLCADDMLQHSKGQVWCQFDEIMQEIREMIDLGIKSKKLKIVQLDENDYLANSFFKSHIFYNPLQFISLAKNNSFRLPDELQVGEHEDGTLFWLNTKTMINKTDIKKKLGQKLDEICPEVEKFYNALKEEIDLIGNYTMAGIEQDDLKNIACDYFDREQNDYKILSHQHIEDQNIYKHVQQKRRRIIGTILQKYLKTNLPSARDHKRIDTTIDSLIKKHNKIIK